MGISGRQGEAPDTGVLCREPLRAIAGRPHFTSGLSVKNLWSERDAATFSGELGQQVYASRLLGRDPNLVLHGGGNTSLKAADPEGDILFVKGSGADLARVGPEHFAALRLEAVKALLEEPALDNPEMARRLDTCIVHRPSPKPSIETLLHAALPFACVDHSHADAILAVINTENGARIAGEVYGELAPLVPYRHSGVELAHACLDVYRTQGTQRTIGLVLQFHGVVSFGGNARESYQNMLRLVERAEAYLDSRGVWALPLAPEPPEAANPLALARLRREVSRVAGKPLIARALRDPVSIAFAEREDLSQISQRGPGTPQHAVFCRRIPMLDRNPAGYAGHYRDYLSRHLGNAWNGIIDPAPRIVLDAELGLIAFGVSARYADIAAELYRHDIEIITRASAHDRYASAPEPFMARAELEYAGFEAAARDNPATPLLGQVAVLTPGAVALDPELAPRLLGQGAAVVAPLPVTARPDPAAHGYQEAIPYAVAAEAALAFGGVDMLHAAPGEKDWHRAFGELLAQSAVAGSMEGLA